MQSSTPFLNALIPLFVTKASCFSFVLVFPNGHFRAGMSFLRYEKRRGRSMKVIRLSPYKSHCFLSLKLNIFQNPFSLPQILMIRFPPSWAFGWPFLYSPGFSSWVFLYTTSLDLWEAIFLQTPTGPKNQSPSSQLYQKGHLSIFRFPPVHHHDSHFLKNRCL